MPEYRRRIQDDIFIERNVRRMARIGSCGDDKMLRLDLVLEPVLLIEDEVG